MQDAGKDDFTLAHYENCIETAIKKGYSFFKMNELDSALKSNMSIIMRHDVDTQIDKAVEIAQIEKNKNIESTFFIRFHSHAYNPMCLRDAYKIKEISRLGHEIGLHYEADYYSIVNSDFNRGLLTEINMLKDITGCNIISVAPHEPTRSGINKITNSVCKELGIKYQAYDDIFLKILNISQTVVVVGVMVQCTTILITIQVTSFTF